jgi:hypothetical protein
VKIYRTTGKLWDSASANPEGSIPIGNILLLISSEKVKDFSGKRFNFLHETKIIYLHLNGYEFKKYLECLT